MAKWDEYGLKAGTSARDEVLIKDSDTNTNKRITVGDIQEFANDKMLEKENATLNTEAKTLIGAINEVDAKNDALEKDKKAIEAALENEKNERTAADTKEKSERQAEIDVERKRINNVYANKLVTLDEIDLVTEEGFFVDALAVKELDNKLKNAETTMNNNLKSLLSEKQVTVKSNINVGAGNDFEYYIKAPTVSGYTPVGIIGYDLVGNWDVWINISSCYYNSGTNMIYTKGHNFGTGASNALLNTFVLYKKNL